MINDDVGTLWYLCTKCIVNVDCYLKHLTRLDNALCVAPADNSTRVSVPASTSFGPITARGFSPPAASWGRAKFLRCVKHGDETKTIIVTIAIKEFETRLF